MTPLALLAHLRGTIRRDAQAVSFAARRCRNVLALVGAVLRRARVSPVVLSDGTTFVAPELRTVIPLINEIYFEHAYDHGCVRVKPGDLVVDIGAHVGVFSLYALARGAANIIAFEPSPENVRYFRQNADRNGATSVQLVEAAVGDRVGTTMLGFGKWSVGNVVVDNVSSESVSAESTERSIEVRTTTLEEIFANHRIDRIDYLKIDCEGSEGAILSAASNEVLQRIDRIALEYHDDWSRINHVGVAQLLMNAGFSIDVVPARGPLGMIYAWRNQ